MDENSSLVWGGLDIQKPIWIPERREVYLAKGYGGGSGHPWALRLLRQSSPTLCLRDGLWAPLTCSPLQCCPVSTRQKPRLFVLLFEVLPPQSNFLSNWITGYYKPWSLQPRKVVSLIQLITSICWVLRAWHSLCWALYWHFHLYNNPLRRYRCSPCHSDKETGLGRLSNLSRSQSR